MLATELQGLVQTKVGTTKFSTIYNQIRQSVLGVRRDRKAAKAMQVTTNPEAAAKRKTQRNAVKKESRKRKDRGFACVTALIIEIIPNHFFFTYSDRQGKSKRRREE